MRLTEPFQHFPPVSEEIVKEPLYLTNVGWERIAPDQPYPGTDCPVLYRFHWAEGRVLPEFTLAHVVEGTGRLQTKLGLQSLAAGDGFLYRPGEWHRHRPEAKTGWIILWITFNGELPRQWVREQAFFLEGNRPVIGNLPLYQDQFEHLLQLVHAHPAANNRQLSWQAVGLISHFLRGAAVDAPAAPYNLTDPVVEKAVTCIWGDSRSSLSVPDVARRVGVGRRTLERRFQDSLGRSVLEEIQRCRVTRAEWLLKETNLPIKEIVTLAGFTGREQMRLVFQRHFGCSPEAHRSHFSIGE